MDPVAENAALRSALDAAEKTLVALSDSYPIGVYHCDRHGARTYTNERWQEIFGLSAQESLGNAWMRALHPDDRADVTSAWQEAVESGRNFDRESDDPLAIVIDVADGGGAVPIDVLPRLFSRGARGRHAGVPTGHGLGLYMRRRTARWPRRTGPQRSAGCHLQALAESVAGLTPGVPGGGCRRQLAFGPSSTEVPKGICSTTAPVSNAERTTFTDSYRPVDRR